MQPSPTGPLRTSTLILISLAATVILYAVLALGLQSHDRWLHSVAGSDASLAERLAFPLRHAVLDWAFIVAIAMTLWAAYRIRANGVLATRRIVGEPVRRSQVIREMFLFGNALIAIGIQGAFYAILREAGYSKRYDDIAEHGWAYAVFSMVLFFILSDAWSYFWHLGYHRFVAFYRVSHHVHHLSVVTTPWTTFQGSPIELLPSTLFSAIMFATLPLATPVLVLIAVASTILTMIAHGGIEIFPRGTATHRLGRFLVTPTYHQTHHELGDRNLALYFNWWDRILGTKDPGYESRFERVTSPTARQRAGAQQAAPQAQPAPLSADELVA